MFGYEVGNCVHRVTIRALVRNLENLYWINRIIACWPGRGASPERSATQPSRRAECPRSRPSANYANGLPADEQAVVADAIQDYNRSGLVGDPASFSLIVGFFGWVVAMFAAAIAFRRAGAGWLVTVLVGLAALFAIHPPPIGPVGLACFAAAAVLIERWRGDTRALSDRSAVPVVTPGALTT